MEKFLGVDKTAPALERSLKAVLPTDLEMESILLEELLSLVEDTHVKTREASQNTDLNMREFLVVNRG